MDVPVIAGSIGFLSENELLLYYLDCCRASLLSCRSVAIFKIDKTDPWSAA